MSDSDAPKQGEIFVFSSEDLLRYTNDAVVRSVEAKALEHLYRCRPPVPTGKFQREGYPSVATLPKIGDEPRYHVGGVIDSNGFQVSTFTVERGETPEPTVTSDYGEFFQRLLKEASASLGVSVSEFEGRCLVAVDFATDERRYAPLPPEKVEEAPVRANRFNYIRNTRDATPWTHNREPWQTHRGKSKRRTSR